MRDLIKGFMQGTGVMLAVYFTIWLMEKFEKVAYYD